MAAFDRLRGLIMVLMAVDHASFFIARVHPAETWAFPPPYYEGAAAFLTRWLTHLCAPGFFLLMGIGVTWFAESRLAAGWSAGRITRFLATRGSVLLLVQHVLENPAWLLGILSMDGAVGARMPPMPGPGGDVMIGLAVLTALGVAMMVGSVLWRAHPGVLVIVCVLAVLTSEWMTPDPSAAFDPQPVWKQLLFVPGATGVLQNMYPWVPWLFPMAAGLALGRAFRQAPDRMGAVSLRLGAFALAVFAAVRLAGGDPHPPGDGLIGFLTITKYPPSPAFFMVTLGLDLLLLAALVKWPARGLAPLEVFGRTPFFFYLAHLWVLGMISWGFPAGATFGVMYLVWGGVMLALYPACRRYAQFKFAQPATSLWRLL